MDYLHIGETVENKTLPDRRLYSVVVSHSFMGMSESLAISRDMMVISVGESRPEHY